MDSLFRDLFQDKRYAAELNKALLEDKSITEKDVNMTACRLLTRRKQLRQLLLKSKGIVY